MSQVATMSQKLSVRLVAVFAALLVSIGLASPVAAAPALTNGGLLGSNPWLNRRVLNMAHQGGELEAPSDTMFAFKSALDKGADVLEMDIHATADGEIVVLHDNTVNRTTNGTGRVDQLTLDQIRALDAAYWFAPNCGTCHDRPESEYIYRGFATGQRPIPPELSQYQPKDFRIPTLKEVLKEFPDEFLNIEIKATVPETTPYEGKVAALLNKYNRGKDTIVVSFHDVAMASFSLYPTKVSKAPGILTTAQFWASTQGDLPGMPLPGYDVLQVPTTFQGFEILTPSFVTKAHNNNLAVHAWTIDTQPEMEQLIDMGVDGLISNRPTLLEQVLEEKGVKYD